MQIQVSNLVSTIIKVRFAQFSTFKSVTIFVASQKSRVYFISGFDCTYACEVVCDVCNSVCDVCDFLRAHAKPR